MLWRAPGGWLRWEEPCDAGKAVPTGGWKAGALPAQGQAVLVLSCSQAQGEASELQGLDGKHRPKPTLPLW